jgi:hypothetical protein
MEKQVITGKVQFSTSNIQSPEKVNAYRPSRGTAPLIYIEGKLFSR